MARNAGEAKVTVSMRWPKELSDRVRKAAAEEGVSLTEFVVRRLSSGDRPLLGVHRDNPAGGAVSAAGRRATEAAVAEDARLARRAERLQAAQGDARFGRRVDPGVFRRVDPARKGKR